MSVNDLSSPLTQYVTCILCTSIVHSVQREVAWRQRRLAPLKRMRRDECSLAWGIGVWSCPAKGTDFARESREFAHLQRRGTEFARRWCSHSSLSWATCACSRLRRLCQRRGYSISAMEKVCWNRFFFHNALMCYTWLLALILHVIFSAVYYFMLWILAVTTGRLWQCSQSGFPTVCINFIGTCNTSINPKPVPVHRLRFILQQLHVQHRPLHITATLITRVPTSANLKMQPLLRAIRLSIHGFLQ